MNSYLFGRKQYSPICNIEEGDESSLKLKLHDGVSPMTYKKLKELGYTSDDWQNWSDDEKVEKSQAEASQASSEKNASTKNNTYREAGSAQSANLPENTKQTQERMRQEGSEAKVTIQKVRKYKNELDEALRSGKYKALTTFEDEVLARHGVPMKSFADVKVAGVSDRNEPSHSLFRRPKDAFVAKCSGWVDDEYFMSNYGAVAAQLDSKFRSEDLSYSYKDTYSSAIISIRNSYETGEPYLPKAINRMKELFASPEYNQYVDAVREIGPSAAQWHTYNNTEEDAKNVAETTYGKLRVMKKLAESKQMSNADMVGKIPAIGNKAAGQKFMESVRYINRNTEATPSWQREDVPVETRRAAATARRQLKNIVEEAHALGVSTAEDFNKLSIPEKYVLFKGIKELSNYSSRPDGYGW